MEYSRVLFARPQGRMHVHNFITPVGLRRVWKEVPMPDRLEDVSGFFGLEEIDGIDVVRPDGNGEAQFKVRFWHATPDIRDMS